MEFRRLRDTDPIRTGGRADVLDRSAAVRAGEVIRERYKEVKTV
jgi:hypothetical protein